MPRLRGDSGHGEGLAEDDERGSAIADQRPNSASRLRVAQPRLLLFGFILGLDLAWIVFSGSTAPTEFGLVDEPAHLATCLLILMAFAAVARRRPTLDFVAAALVASVALDLDHLPQYLGWDGLNGGGPRPYPHSLLTVALFASLAWVVRGRTRPIALGAAFGVAAHLFRDLATGPGAALLWPVSGAAVGLPYALFAIGLALAVALASAPSFLADDERDQLAR